MNACWSAALVAAVAAAIAGCATTSTPGGRQAAVAQENALQAASTSMPQMTAAQSAQYRADYQAAKAKWASMTPAEQASVVASARQKRIADLTAMERVGQNNDMLRETQAQSAESRAQYEAAKEAWAKLTPEQKQAATRAAWSKKRADLSWMERVGQNDDAYLLPQ